MYTSLAAIYDSLVKDDEATQQWTHFTERYLPKGSRILELACGSAEITHSLAQMGYSILATDLSEEMLEQAQLKEVGNQIEWQKADMQNFHFNEKFDGVICYCDSVNYLANEAAVKQMLDCVEQHLKPKGFFLFDVHTLERLDEFEEEFIEEGTLEEIQYQWTIQTERPYLHHHFTFWRKDGTIEQETHVQTVFDPQWIVKTMENQGWSVECWTDFDQKGIHIGEKIEIVGRKKA